MNNRKNCLMICLIMIVVSIVIVGHLSVPIKQYEARDYSQDWTYITPSGESKIISLPIQLKLPKNTPVVLKKTCLVDSLYRESISFPSLYQNIEIKINGTIIYQNSGFASAAHENASYRSWNTIELFSETNEYLNALSKGNYCELEIVFTSPYSMYSGNISKIRIGEYTELILLQEQKYQIIFVMDMGIFCIGLFIFLFSLFNAIRLKEIPTSIFLGIFAIIVAMWFRTSTIGTPFITLNEITVYYISAFSLMLMPIPYILYIKFKGFEKKKLIYVLLYTYFGLFLCTNTSYILGITDYVEWFIVYYIVFVAGALLIIINYIEIFIRNRERTINIEIVGILIMLMMGILEMIPIFLTNNLNNGAAIRLGLIFYLGCVGYQTFKDYQIARIKHVQETSDLRKANMQLAISQIHPHFVFNALGAIRVMTKMNPDMAYQMIYDFSKYLRANLDTLDNKEPIPFLKEMEHVKSYVNIEKIRFGNIEIEYRLIATDFVIPPMTIQPIVENAIRHGLRKGKRGGKVLVYSFETDSEFIVIVKDDGEGFEVGNLLKGQMEETSTVGLKNIQYRLKKIIDAKIEVESEKEKGTEVTITIKKNFFVK